MRAPDSPMDSRSAAARLRSRRSSSDPSFSLKALKPESRARWVRSRTSVGWMAYDDQKVRDLTQSREHAGSGPAPSGRHMPSIRLTSRSQDSHAAESEYA